MFCSGSESAQVEHLRPKKHFPLDALRWENLLWVCGICNLHKGDRLGQGLEMVDPLSENVWQFCFIDEYGNMASVWRADLGDIDPRGDFTIGLLKLNRDALQLTRQSRLDDLKQQIDDTLVLFHGGLLTVEDLRQRLDTWRRVPFQPDVADYFLSGPGRAEAPFSVILALAEA